MGGKDNNKQLVKSKTALTLYNNNKTTISFRDIRFCIKIICMTQRVTGVEQSDDFEYVCRRIEILTLD